MSKAFGQSYCQSIGETAFLRQPGQRETITVIEAVGEFGEEIPPMVIMKGEEHLYGWYYGEMPDHWITEVSPNGWRIDFSPHNGWNATSSHMPAQRGEAMYIDSKSVIETSLTSPTSSPNMLTLIESNAFARPLTVLIFATTRCCDSRSVSSRILKGPRQPRNHRC